MQEQKRNKVKKRAGFRTVSTETHVFFRGGLPSKAALSRAMKELGFPFAIKPATGSLEQQNGFMPMLLRQEETGVEFDVFSDRSDVEEFAAQGVDPSRYERVANFRWGGDFQEAVAGMCGAAALAKLVNGLVFDEAENRLLSVDDAVALARQNLEALRKLPKQRSPRGRTLLKRMLAPLLAKRSDLALVGDLLVIQPVRHLIRGVEFRWYDRQTVCSACPYLRPLYQPSNLFRADAALNDAIADPDFAPMLFDRLAAEVFEPLGKIATIEDFLASNWGERLRGLDLYPSILLSRGIAQAKAYLAPFDARGEKAVALAEERLAQTDRADRVIFNIHRSLLEEAKANIPIAEARQRFLDRGDAAVFSYYRAWEAEVARGLKIEQAWEPSPFPAELPAAQRAARSSDPIFTPTPWLEFSGSWWQDPPDAPGEVRYGRHWWDQRHGRVRLIHPITREQAEMRHRDSRYYVLATRLPKGQLLVLTHSVSQDRMFPTVQYMLWAYDSRDDYMIVRFDEDYSEPGALRMRSIDIRGQRGWHSYLNFEDGEKVMHDHRGDEVSYECRTMTETDRSAYVFPLPLFGDFNALWQRISMYLRDEGFGAFA